MDIQDLKFLKVAIKKHPKTDLTLEFLLKQDAIGALILNKEGDKALLVKQYRPGADKEMYEIPAGLIDPGEKAIDTLHREILEETGYESKHYDIIIDCPTPLFVSPGYSQEKIYLYVVQLKNDNIVPNSLKLDVGEDLTNHWFNLEDIESYSQDMKTNFALYLYKIKAEK